MSIGGQQLTTSMLATSTPLKSTNLDGGRSAAPSRSGLMRALVNRSTVAANRPDANSATALSSTTASSTGLASAIRRCSEQGTVSSRAMESRAISEAIPETVATAQARTASAEVVTLLLVTDRRRSTRHSCDKPVAVRILNSIGQSASNRSFTARMVDVAATGIALLSSETFASGQRLSVEFLAEDNAEIDARSGSSEAEARNVLTGAVLRSELISAGKPERRIVFVPDHPLTTAQIASLGADLFAGTIV